MNKLLRKKFVITVLILTLLLQTVVLSSCNRRYDEDEVITATKVLLKDAEKLNLIYYGEGIKYHEDDDSTKGYYRKAQESHLDELGFHTVDELKEMTEKTFSKDYSSLLYSTVLSALMSDGTLVNATRYYQAYDETTEEPTYIMVHSKFSHLMSGSVEYDYNSIEVTGSKKEKVFVTVIAKVTNEEGDSQNTEIVITLIEEDDGWKIDNPTYANYNAMRNE